MTRIVRHVSVVVACVLSILVLVRIDSGLTVWMLAATTVVLILAICLVAAERVEEPTPAARPLAACHRARRSHRCREVV